MVIVIQTRSQRRLLGKGAHLLIGSGRKRLCVTPADCHGMIGHWMSGHDPLAQERRPGAADVVARQREDVVVTDHERRHCRRRRRCSRHRRNVFSWAGNQLTLLV